MQNNATFRRARGDEPGRWQRVELCGEASVPRRGVMPASTKLASRQQALNGTVAVPFYTTREWMSIDSFRFDIVDHVMLVVHADMPPSDHEWARMVVVRNANRDRLRSTLVIAPPRASINASQRADVAHFMKETGITIAVVTDSALIRGVARAVGFLGVQVRAFAPNELSTALTFMIVPPSRHAEFTRRIEQMKAQLASNARSASL